MSGMLVMSTTPLSGVVDPTRPERQAQNETRGKSFNGRSLILMISLVQRASETNKESQQSWNEWAESTSRLETNK